VLSRLTLEDVSEFLLTQEWNGWVEPYTVSFWLRRPGEEWGWCYVDHEASRWRSASLRLDEERRSVQVLRAGALEAELLLERSSFALYGSRTTECAAPQETRQPPFPVRDSG